LQHIQISGDIETMVDVDRNKITQVFLGILVLVAVGVVLKYAASVILPLIIAWLFSYLIGPVVNYMTQRKVPTTLAVVIILCPHLSPYTCIWGSNLRLTFTKFHQKSNVDLTLI
jgi:hypothetical protein